MSQRKEYYEYPLRTCMTLHVCNVCDHQIMAGQKYFDGGYSRRCHEKCAPPNNVDTPDRKGHASGCTSTVSFRSHDGMRCTGCDTLLGR